jgi:hypothetical protein
VRERARISGAGPSTHGMLTAPWTARVSAGPGTDARGGRKRERSRVTYMRVPSRGPYVRVFDVSVQLRSRPSGRGGGARAVALCRSRVPSLLSDTGHTASTQVHPGRLTMLAQTQCQP